MVALWRSKDFLHLKIYSIAEVVALTQEDGDIEHTKEILENDTKTTKKVGLCYATGKMLQRGRKKQRPCGTRGRKIFPFGKTANRRCSKNAQRRKIA